MQPIFHSKKAWDSGSDNILEDFYKPALMHAKRYRRLTGFFVWENWSLLP